MPPLEPNPATDGEILALHDVAWQTAGRSILGPVTCAIARGESVAVVGPNGAGKSTLLKCLAGIIDSWTGQIRVAGRDLHGMASRERARQISYVPQPGDTPPPFTVEEFVAMARYPWLAGLARPGVADQAAVERALDLTATGAWRGRQIVTLSGGERQRVHIAAALAQDAAILLLDEPTAFLDYRQQALVLALLRRIRREAGKTIVAVHHDINQAAAGSDRILALDAGRITYWGPAADALQAGILESIYGLPFRLLAEAGRPLPLALPR